MIFYELVIDYEKSAEKSEKYQKYRKFKKTTKIEEKWAKVANFMSRSNGKSAKVNQSIKNLVAPPLTGLYCLV